MSTTTSEHVPPSVDDDGPVSTEHLAVAESADDSFVDAPPVVEDGAISDVRHHARQRRSRITLIVVPAGTVPAEARADERSGAYRATEYALCHLAKVPAPEPDFLTDVGTIAMKLPRPVRALLEHADVRSFTPPVLDEDGHFVGIGGHQGDPGPGVDCYVMSADLVGAVWGHTRPDLGQTEQDVRFRTDDSAFATMEGIDGSEMILISIPIIPTAAGSCGAAERRLGVHHRLEQAT